MHFTVPVYEVRTGSVIHWTTLRLGDDTKTFSGHSAAPLEQKLIDTLRPMLAKTRPHEIERFQLVRGMRVERVRLEVELRGEGGRRKASGICPLVIEPRWATADAPLHVVYHPARQSEPFWMRPDEDLAARARQHFQVAWAELDDRAVAALWSERKARIVVVGFSADARSPFEDLPSRKIGGLGDDRPKPKNQRILGELAENLTQKVARGSIDAGVPRSPFREQLQLLLSTRKKQSTLVVGPPGCGKSTLVHRWIADLLEADGYPSHRNFDRAHVVWSLSGKRILAGMSRIGEWEKRTSAIIDAARSERVVLFMTDIAHFGRTGRSRESDRALADMFRGPVARHQITLIGECTPSELRLLEEDAPAFASLFRVVHVPEASNDETFRLMLRAVRALERRYGARVSPLAIRTILELGGALMAARARPGRALDLLTELARGARDDRELATIDTPQVIAALAQKTGLPQVLLRSDVALDVTALEEQLAQQVRGQREAVRIAASLIVRIKAGLTDPRRPHGVLLLTGPTGTGKTELAKCIAEYLYGSASRLLRFDMSEFSGPDAPSRLIGDRWRPEGILTRQVQEQPFSVVLFDEIEKAHPSALSLLLQLFDDARLTDASGATADFAQTAIVMTSNLGARARSTVGFGEAEDAVMHDVAKAVRDFFPPELFNRIDRIVPFRPLSREVAAEVAKKELAKLLARSGLVERNVFVHANASVAPRLAEEAFRAEDGARSVKRYLEDHIGSLLTDAIAGSTSAAMQVIRIHASRAGRFGVVREAIGEVEPAPGSSALEPLLGLSVARLKEQLPSLLDFLTRLESGSALERLSERLRAHLEEHRLGDAAQATPIYNLESTRSAFRAFRERVEALTQADEPHERLEAERFGVAQLATSAFGEWRYRLFSRAMMAPPSLRHSKDEILAVIAEGYFLRRILERVDASHGHAVLLELLRTAEPPVADRFEARSPGLLEALAGLYAGARGSLEGCAGRGENGAITASTSADAAAVLDRLVKGRTPHVVLGIAGLSVLDFFALENGTHVWHSRDGVEVVRVRVVAAANPSDAGALLADHATRLAAFERALDDGETHGDNPAALLPLVRTIRFDPPRRAGALAAADVEDYALGYAAIRHVRGLDEAIAPLSLLAMSHDRIASGARP